MYDSGLGFGDFTLARATVAGHTAAAADEAVLVQADASATAALDEIAARYPGGG
ncbi:hypothetical protein GCM10020218_086700 [Dactylosporangium vinaceum]